MQVFRNSNLLLKAQILSLAKKILVIVFLEVTGLLIFEKMAAKYQSLHYIIKNNVPCKTWLVRLQPEQPPKGFSSRPGLPWMRMRKPSD